MPVDPSFLERLVLFRLNRGPAPVLDLFGAAGFEAVTLALDLGVFEALGDGALAPGELAARLGADEDGLRLLLDFLAAQGYVAAAGDRYRATAMTRKWLTGDGPNLAPFLAFWDELVFPFWEANLETAVREGEPPVTVYEWFDEEPGRWETAQRGFRAAASVVVDEVVGGLPTEEATHVLDVGGGHGLFAVELCRRDPALTATVFDHPEALAVAREEVAAAGLNGRVEIRGGDYRTDDLGSGYDLALLFNVIHAHDAAENTRLFERVAGALEPGGVIAVLDQLEGTARSPVGQAGLAFVALTYHATLGAQTHPYEAVTDWLRAAGFEDVRRRSVRGAGPGNTLVLADRPGGGVSPPGNTSPPTGSERGNYPAVNGVLPPGDCRTHPRSAGGAPRAV